LIKDGLSKTATTGNGAEIDDNGKRRAFPELTGYSRRSGAIFWLWVANSWYREIRLREATS
jgi:hypothetical protein